MYVCSYETCLHSRVTNHNAKAGAGEVKKTAKACDTRTHVCSYETNYVHNSVTDHNAKADAGEVKKTKAQACDTCVLIRDLCT